MKIKFDKKLYKKKAIDQAKDMFAHLGNFSVVSKKDFYEVEIKKLPKDASDMIKNEFCNHVLFLMNKKI